MNRRILRLAIPNVISNITIPLLGMIDIAIAGRLGHDGAIGAIAIGAAIFGFIYWNCAFVRMGMSGLTAQALGRRDFKEAGNLLIRGIVLCLIMALLLLVFQRPVGHAAMRIMKGSDEVMAMVTTYFFARVWAAPATITQYAIHGWFIGMQNSRTPMWVAIMMNVANLTFSLLFVYVFDMGVAGIAWGTVITQYCGLAMSAAIWFKYYRRILKYIDLRESLRLRPLVSFFNVNKDIFLRNVCNVAVYTYFTVASSGMGDTLLAANTILIQLFTFFSYMADGFAYAAEALTGKFLGARNYKSLRQSIINIFWWSFAMAGLFVVIYRLFWRNIFFVFTDSASIVEAAGQYIVWIMIVPLVGFAPFLMDGIMVGATKTKILRNSMFFSTLLFFLLYFSLTPHLGNNALWLAFIVFLSSRGVLQYFMSGRMEGLVRHTASSK